VLFKSFIETLKSDFDEELAHAFLQYLILDRKYGNLTYENYTNTIVAAVINVILFPAAFLIYKKGVKINE
jgi:hypothetical protein